MSEGYTAGGYYYAAFAFCMAEHGGTHLDAPIHFAEGKHSADEVPLERLIGPGIVVDVSEQAMQDRDYLIGPDDLETWEKEYDQTIDEKIVLIKTGYGRFWPDREAYLGTALTGPEAIPHLHFPGLSAEAAQWIVDNRKIRAIGFDVASVDYGQSADFPAHRILFEQNIPAFENVANLDALPAHGFHIVALPMKVAGGSGGPLRIVACIE